MEYELILSQSTKLVAARTGTAQLLSAAFLGHGNGTVAAAFAAFSISEVGSTPSPKNTANK